MFCMNCGKELPDGAKFCDKCGTKVLLADDSFASKVRAAKVYMEYFGFNSNDKIVVNFDDIDTVELGTYPQNDITGKFSEKICWFVLDKDLMNNKALLISKYSLDIYHEERDTFRYWNYFKTDYFDKFVTSLIFTDKEKANIIESDVINERIKIKCREYDMNGGNSKDKIFILNLKETIKYMCAHGFNYDVEDEDWKKHVYNSNSYRFNRWILTKYAQSKVNEQIKYHLIRNYTNYTGSVEMLGIDENGDIHEFRGDGEAVGIRPAMWVKI